MVPYIENPVILVFWISTSVLRKYNKNDTSVKVFVSLIWNIYSYQLCTVNVWFCGKNVKIGYITNTYHTLNFWRLRLNFPWTCKVANWISLVCKALSKMSKTLLQVENTKDFAVGSSFLILIKVFTTASILVERLPLTAS